MTIGTDVVKKSRWRLNTSLLHDQVFANSIEEDLKRFFEVNVGSVARMGTVWEASKAFIRGKIIAYSSKKKRKYREKLLKLEAQLKEKEMDLVENLTEILLKKVEYALFRLNSNFYESGDKAGKLLARQLQQKDAKLIIPAIQNIQGEVVTTTKEINKVFHDFYAGLCLSEMNPSPDKIDAFFSKINFPKLTEEQGKKLDEAITEQEVRDAILSLKVGKSPGLDGFPVEYYKRFIYTLAPILTNVYTEAFSSGKLPDTFSEALISLIIKKDKDPTDPGSFRPISLINVDSKIITKIPATRLERVMAHLIHTGQVGFVRGRASSDNVRRLFHLFWSSCENDTPVAAFFLDTEKAFDRVEWGFQVHTLRRFGFGDGFIKWVRVIYSNPKACVLTNGLMSPFFNLTRSSKQGDPLSPLLFILFLEPLAAVLRAETCIKGLWGGGCENKLFMYADDILLLVSDPAKSIPLVLVENSSRIRLRSFQKLIGISQK